jgi:hypothetical protein
MKKLLIPVVLGLGTLALAPAAHATDITNPADNPAPITVTVGGQSYTDGQDTLPGYDDYACTAIPGVEYDFADNEVIYHTDNGTKSVHWTEWDRIAGYQTWKAQQSSPKPSPSSSAPTSTSGSGGSTSSGSAKASSSKSAAVKSPAKSTKSKSAAPTRTASPAPSATASTTAAASSASPDPSDDPSASVSPSATGTTVVAPVATGASPSTDVAPAAATEATPAAAASPSSTRLSSAVTDSVGKGAGNTTLAGGAILAALALASVALLLGHTLRSAVGRRVRS